MPNKPSLEEMKAAILARQGKPSLEEMKATILARQGGETSEQSDADVEDVMHPDISTLSRLAIKNFAGDDRQAQIDYLRAQHKDLTFDLRNGEIVAKRPEEKTWKKLDPGSFSVGEALRDVGDIGYDIGAGLASGAATAAGGVAGALGGGIGALPAAAAAGGTSSAVLEALRQAIGKGIGVNKEVSGTDVAISGVLGAASPFVFGTGANAGKTVTQMVKEGAGEKLRGFLGKQGITGSGALSEAEIAAAKEALTESQRGVAKYLPNLAASLTGVSTEAVKASTEKVGPKLAKELGLPENMTFLEFADELNKVGNAELIEKVQALGNKDLTGLVSRLQNEIGSAIDSLSTAEQPVLFDLAKYRKIFADKAAELRSLGTGDAIAVADELEKEGAKLLKVSVGSDLVNAKQFMGIKNRLADAAGYAAHKSTSPASGDVEQTARVAWSEMTKDLWPYIEKANTALVKDKKIDLRQAYRNAEDLVRLVKPKFKTAEKVENLLRRTNLENPRYLNQKLKYLDREYGLPIGDASKAVDVQKYFANPPWLAISGENAPATARILTGRGIGALTGAMIGSQLGGSTGGYVGGGTGALVGGAMFSPAMLKALLKAGIKTGLAGGKSGEALSAFARGLQRTGGLNSPATESAWNYVTSRGQQ